MLVLSSAVAAARTLWPRALTGDVGVLREVAADVLVDAAERQRVPGAGAAVVVLRLPHLWLGGADGDDGVDHEVAGDDVDDGIR